MDKEDDHWREIARGNVEQHLSDAVGDHGEDEPSADTIYDEALTLAFDALHDAGVEKGRAHRIAVEVAMCFAQP